MTSSSRESTTQSRGVMVAAFGMVYQQAVSFLSGLIIARVVGAADYGIVSLARNIMLAVGIYARLGLDIGLQRFIGEPLHGSIEQRQRLTILRGFRLLACLVSVVPFVILAMGLGPWVQQHIYRYEDFSSVLLVTFLALPFLSDVAVLGGAYRGMLNPAPPITAEFIIMPTVRLFAIVAMFALGMRLWAVVIGTSLASTVAFAYLAVRFKKYRRAQSCPALSVVEARRQISVTTKYSIVIAMGMGMTTLTRSTDTFFLGHYAAAKDVGQYSLVQMMLILVGLFGAALGQSLGAQVARCYAERNLQGIENLLANNARQIALVSCPLFAIFFFWGSDLALVFGNSYMVATAVVRWLALTSLVVTLTASAGFSLSMTGHQWLELMVLSLGLLFTIVLCRAIIPAWGQLGAAVAVCTAVVLTNTLRLFVVWRRFSIFHLRGDLLVIGFLPMALAWCVSQTGGGFGIERIVRAMTGAAVFATLYAVIAWFVLLRDAERSRLIQIMHWRRLKPVV
ncbi:MAG TPA: oligosaccharide flippase family protein [Rhodocyclaceae bacterium]|nr:oligosaccharide flippase family protein [Rhodocyclaceae bacterium]